jgi:hypothetical protein
MSELQTIAIISDLHYTCAAEQARGRQEHQVVPNPLLAIIARFFRHYIWLRHPLQQNHLLDLFLARVGNPDYVVANGDYSCDTAFVGVSDDLVCQSVKECISQLRSRFGARLQATLGDHELGKMSLFGGTGGLRLSSWHRVQTEVGLEPFWHFELGRYQFVGVTSSLLALPVYVPEILPAERHQWFELRAAHRAEIKMFFDQIEPQQKIVLFCHDPTALPFLKREAIIPKRLAQIEQTWIGHLHSRLIFSTSRLLTGMPEIRFLGNSIRRMSAALHDASDWWPFHVHLCPALAGIQLLKDGGYCLLQVDPQARQAIQVQFVRLRSPPHPSG